MKRIICIILAICMLTSLSALVSCGNEKNDKARPAAQVTITTNPEISLILDNNGTVVSVKGENDDGKMIVEGEALVGKDVDEAIKTIITLEKETGFLISGTDGENEISFSVSAEDSTITANFESQVNESINSACVSLDLNKVITRVEGAKRAALEAYVKRIDPSLTDEQVKAMDHSELMAEISEYHKEVEALVSDELEELYLTCKEYHIELTYNKAVIDTISLMGSAYSSVLEAYQKLYDSLEKLIDSLEKLKYELLVDPDSEYQKSLSSYYEAKAKLNEYKAEFTALGDDASIIEKSVKQGLISSAEIALNTKKALLDTAAANTQTAFDYTQSGLNTVLEEMAKARAEFPDSIEEQLTAKAADIEKALNTAKDDAFNAFEKDYAAAISAQKKRVEERKASLKNGK